MGEPQATCEDPFLVEEPKPSSKDIAKMTGPVVTCGNIRGAKLGKKVTGQILDQENIRKGGYIDDRPLEGSDGELPTKADMKTVSDHPSMDVCVSITEEDADDLHEASPPVEGVDLLHGLPEESSHGSGGSRNGAGEDLEINLEENEAKEPAESSKLLQETEEHLEQECPICTELYDTSKHKQSLLNCNHVFCDNCIKTMVNTANRANLCRVTCPLCRQTTPMLEWEVRKMQEQMMESGGVCVQQDYVQPQPLVRRPGICGALEYRFHKRLRTGRLPFPPCIRNPHRLAERLAQLEHQCRCLYLLALVFLIFAEFFCFTFLFLPILIFILMIILGK